MSSTDKTRPAHVKLLENPELFLDAWHFHEFTDECDLPPRPRRADATHPEEWDGTLTRCSWWPSEAARSTPAIRKDVVYAATTPASRRLDRRRERHEGRVAVAEGLDAHLHDDPGPASPAPWPAQDQEAVEDFYHLARLTRLLDLPHGHHVVEATWDGMVTVMAPDGTRSRVGADRVQHATRASQH